jgi:hypothetical protein
MTSNLTFKILKSTPIQFMFGYQKHEIRILCMVLRWKRKNRPPGTSRIKEGSAGEKEEEKKGALAADHEEEGISRWDEEDYWGWEENQSPLVRVG